MATCPECGDRNSEPGETCTACGDGIYVADGGVERAEAGASAPGESAYREVDPDELADESDPETPDLDWDGFVEHAPAEKDRAGQRKGVYDGIGDYLRRFGLGALRVAGAGCVLLAAFMALGARFDESGVWPRAMVGASPAAVALLTTLMGAHVRWVRRFCRDGSFVGAVGFVAAHLPDPGDMAAALADDPVWFLEAVDHLPWGEVAAEWLRWGATGYASVLASVFG